MTYEYKGDVEGGQNLVVAEGACVTSTVLEDDAGDDDEGGVRDYTGSIFRVRRRGISWTRGRGSPRKAPE